MRLPVRVSASQARRRLLARRRWPRGSGPQVARQELVWLPAAIAQVASNGGPRKHGSGSSALCVVERVLGHAWMVASPGVELETETPVEGRDGSLEPRLAVAECASRAAACLGRGLSMARATANVGAEPECQEASYPFWALYLRRRRKLDLRILDAVTGRRASSGIRAAIVTAILEAAQPDAGSTGQPVAGSGHDSTAVGAARADAGRGTTDDERPTTDG